MKPYFSVKDKGKVYIKKKEQTEMTTETTEKFEVDMTPTWEGLMPAMIELVKQGNKVAEDELMKLARSVDQRNAEMKETIDERNS